MCWPVQGLELPGGETRPELTVRDHMSADGSGREEAANPGRRPFGRSDPGSRRRPGAGGAPEAAPAQGTAVFTHAS